LSSARVSHKKTTLYPRWWNKYPFPLQSGEGEKSSL
jgi:hypothetical protein